MSFPFDWKQLDCPEIRRAAEWCRDLDDFFTSIEDLYEKLSNLPAEKIQFVGEEEIHLALLMLADGLLPSHSHAALAKILINAFHEIRSKKYAVEALYVKPPKRGRKSTAERDSWIILHVARLKLDGDSTENSYEYIAKMLSVSKDTVRRIYERANEERKKKGFKRLP